jgi:plasmid stabilization system protein ParE
VKVRYAAGAQADRLAISVYLSERSPVGQRKVLLAILETVDHIAAQPNSGRATDVGSIRVRLVRRYPYRVFYRVADDTIEVLQIRHMARRPGDYE